MSSKHFKQALIEWIFGHIFWDKLQSAEFPVNEVEWNKNLHISDTVAQLYYWISATTPDCEFTS